MKDTSFKIILDKNMFEHDEFITGKISLKTRIPLLIKSIQLNLSKTRLMEICKIKTSASEAIKFSKNTTEYSYNFDIITSTSDCTEISSGAHIFPFKFCLKNSDSSTTEIKGIYFDYLVNIQNLYTLSAFLLVENVLEPFYKTKKNLQIIEITDKAEHFQTKIELSTILCLLYKTYTINFFLDKSLYYSGDTMSLTIQMNRSLNKLIKNIECNLYEVINIHSSDFDILRTRYVVGGNALLEKKNFFLSLRIPSCTPTSVNENTFGLKILMFINITFKNGGPIRIKKYLQVVKRHNEIPEIENLNVLEGEVFDEKIFVLT